MTSTVKLAIAESLDDLSQEDFLKFCDHLRDRREDPRVSFRAVEGKRRWEVADVLVSTFTELKALQVTLDLLRQIKKNEEAKALESKTKVRVDKGETHLRRTSTGMLELKPSADALKRAARPLQAAQHTGPLVKKPGEVMAEAKACVLSEDPCDERLLLSKFTLQFGKYKGQTFEWLLENDVGYAAFVVAGHQREKKPVPQQGNKDSLTKYAKAFPEVMEEVRFLCAYEEAQERSRMPGQGGEALVGFGAHRWETLQNLYESSDPGKIRYVNFLRTKTSTCTQGSKMEIAIKYILQRDQDQEQAPKVQGWPRSRGSKKKF